MTIRTAALLSLALAIPGGVLAQNTTQPAPPTTSSLGGLGGLLGGGLPNVASTSAGNAAGVLGYCVKNNVLQGANAASVLGTLTGKPGIATSPGFAAGQAGTLQAGSGSALSLKGLKGQIRTRLCSLVLKRASSFL